MKASTMKKIKRTLVALAICTAGDGYGTPAAVIGTGIGLVAVGKGGQAALNQIDASTSSNSNGTNALNNNIQNSISGSQSVQVQNSRQAPGL